MAPLGDQLVNDVGAQQGLHRGRFMTGGAGSGLDIGIVVPVETG